MACYHKKDTDIKISNFILKNHTEMPLFNYHGLDAMIYCNHPSNAILVECTNQILNILNKPHINYSGGQLIRGSYSISKYDMNHYKFNFPVNISNEINTYYKNLISEMYNIL